jgi:hypothetical protein
VQVVPPEIDDALSIRARNVGVANIPLARDRPIEDLRSRRDLANLERRILSQGAQCLADAGSGDAPAEGIQAAREGMHLLAGRLVHQRGACGRCRRTGCVSSRHQ